MPSTATLGLLRIQENLRPEFATPFKAKPILAEEGEDARILICRHSKRLRQISLPGYVQRSKSNALSGYDSSKETCLLRG